jgi:hypothetical protein
MFLLFICSIDAMENNMCLFNRLPVDVLDFIAHFLTCDDETEEQFIARILANQQEKDREEEECRMSEVVSRSSFCCTAENIYNNKLIFLYKEKKELALRDCTSNKVYKYKDLKKAEYGCCASSPSGKMIAIFYTIFLPDEQYHTPMLEILKVETEDVQGQKDGNLIVQNRRELLRYVYKMRDEYKYYICHIDFNKQGTHLIVRSRLDMNHTIFPLKIVDLNEPQVIVPTTNKLQEYLRDKFVCNKYIEGKK